MILRPLHLGVLERLADLDKDDPGAWWSFTLIAGRDFTARKAKAPFLSELRARGLVERNPEAPAYRISAAGEAKLREAG